MSESGDTGPVSFLIVMGVSGSGKTTLAALLARLLRWEFMDGDSLHPDANVQKMHGGVPLTDEDRWPWLRSIAAWIDGRRAEGTRAVVACSALKRSYRDVLIGGHGDVRLVYLKADADTVRHRMSMRQGHFMPVSLLQSQLDTLEEPGPEEKPVTVSADAEPQAIAERVLSALELQPPA